MTVFQYIEAYAQPYGMTCVKCGSHLHLTAVDGGKATKVRCLARHCEQYGWVGTIDSERVSLIAARDDSPVTDAPVIDVTPEKVGGSE